jgi:Zn-dependent protease with chaperone function
MTVACLVALAASIGYAAAGPALARDLTPAVAVRLLVVASVVVAASSLVVLFVVALIWVGQLPVVANYYDWSAETLRSTDPLPIVVGVVSALLVAAILPCLATVALRRTRALWTARRACRRRARGGLVVVDTDRATAFATPVGGGRIVVTTGLLRVLSADERRALLAHEASHLSHGHVWWVLAADLAAAANPLLRRAARHVNHTVERWADEDAAREVGDRQVVARALARAALHRHGSPAARRHLGRVAFDAPHGPALAALGGQVPDRVRALLDPPPRRHSLLAAVTLVALLLTSAVAAVVAQQHTKSLLHNADAARSTGATIQVEPRRTAACRSRVEQLAVLVVPHSSHWDRGSPQRHGCR